MKIYCDHDGYAYQGIPSRKNLRKLEAGMKYALKVSNDAGLTYYMVQESNSYMEFADRCRAFDGHGFPWLIQDEQGNVLTEDKFLCLIHRALSRNLGLLAGSKPRPYIPAFYE